ncbi:MAG: hypothetical protein OHK0022_03070 [Roseiflexaceae bacterium]
MATILDSTTSLPGYFVPVPFPMFLHLCGVRRRWDPARSRTTYESGGAGLHVRGGQIVGAQLRGEELALHEFCGLWRALGRVLEDNTRSLPELPPDGYLLRRAQVPIEAELLFPSRAGRTFYGSPLGVSYRCAGAELLFDAHTPDAPVLAAFGADNIALDALLRDLPAVVALLLHAPVQRNRLRAAAGLAPDITS